MPDPTCRMLAVDSDGTLTDSRKQLTPRTVDAVHRAIDAGVTLVPASGRLLAGMAPVADELGLDGRGGYVLSNNGALIVEWKTKLVIEDLVLPRSAVDLSCRIAREYGVQAICYDDTQAYSENPDDPYVEHERLNNSPTMNRLDDLAEAVTNAFDDVKPHADPICPANDDDGVAAVIDERILGNA